MFGGVSGASHKLYQSARELTPGWGRHDCLGGARPGKHRQVLVGVRGRTPSKHRYDTRARARTRASCRPAWAGRTAWPPGPLGRTVPLRRAMRIGISRRSPLRRVKPRTPILLAVGGSMTDRSGTSRSPVTAAPRWHSACVSPRQGTLPLSLLNLLLSPLRDDREMSARRMPA